MCKLLHKKSFLIITISDADNGSYILSISYSYSLINTSLLRY